jgi:hypothetical protein
MQLKDMSTARDMHTTTGELLEVVFSKGSMPRLYNNNWSRVVTPLLLQKGRPHFKIRKSPEKKI